MIIAGMLCLMPVMPATAQNSKLTVKFDGVADGDTIGLVLIDGDSRKPAYNAVVANGVAVINLNIPGERGFYKGFQVVSISADKREADWLKALEDEKLPWLNDRDTDSKGIADLYKVQYYPTIYLLDAEGKVVAKDIRGEELAAKLKELFSGD